MAKGGGQLPPLGSALDLKRFLRYLKKLLLKKVCLGLRVPKTSFLFKKKTENGLFPGQHNRGDIFLEKGGSEIFRTPVSQKQVEISKRSWKY